MSAKNRQSSSKVFDIYPSPTKLIAAGFEKLAHEYGPQISQLTHFLEPGAGFGPFCRMASVYFPSPLVTIGVELQPPKDRYEYTLARRDFLTWRTNMRFGLIGTNPPFTKAEDFILRSRQLLAPKGLMLYLMRVGMLGSKRRREFWQQVNLLEVWLIRPRPSFQKEGGSDASEYAFFLMGDETGAHCSENVKLSWLDWDATEESDGEIPLDE